MFRAVDHDDAKTMLLSSQVLRLARMKCEPTAAGQCRILTGFPWCAGSLSDHTPFVVVNAGGGAPEQIPAILGHGAEYAAYPGRHAERLIAVAR
jgi:hypothetical protein